MADYLESAIAIAREAGVLVEQVATRRHRLREKTFDLKGDFDLVTEADRASEALIVQRLTERFPDHSIVAEEGGGGDRASEYCWYVDPVDGTTNFAHGFPVYNVTLALAKRGEVIAGVVYDPTRDETFAAERGGGAFLNNERIGVSAAARVEDALVATGFPSRKRHQNVNVHFYYQLAMLSHGVRRAGAAAIDLAYVAAGRLDAFWEFALNPWDMAAGALLVEEAGGQLSTMSGEPYSLSCPHLLATNRQLHLEIVALFERIYAGDVQYVIPAVR